jgi:hypothetical protein
MRGIQSSGSADTPTAEQRERWDRINEHRKAAGLDLMGDTHLAAMDRYRLAEYEAAAERFNRASARIPEARAEAFRLMADAEAEYEAAAADLARYESKPGVPLPQYRRH